MKILLLGSNGQLGSDLLNALEGKNVLPLTHADIDIRDGERVYRVLNEYCPDVVINTVAYHKVDEIEINSEKAFEVNAFATFHLAEACREHNAALVHFSTDYVFGGDQNRRTPYSENDKPDPVNVYGASKLSGEHLIKITWEKHYIVRTSGLYGIRGASGKGGNFVETMLRLENEGKPIRVVNDQCLTPTFTADLAGAINQLIETNQFGLYHITNEGYCTWYEFAAKIFELAGLHPDLSPTTSTEFKTTARRPQYSVLAKNGIYQIGLPTMRHWHNALQDYLSIRTQKHQESL